MGKHYDEYDYDYYGLASNCEDLYMEDYEDSEEDEDVSDWENYYHNIADELIDD